MPRSRPTSNPVSYHKHTKQYYVTRDSRRIYLGSDKEQALEKYHRLGLGLQLPAVEEVAPNPLISVKELANRFIAAQRANWRNPETTLTCYKGWLGRFLRDHPRLMASALTVEAFADWKLSLKERGYSAESINHYLSAVRAMYVFAEETDLIQKAPKLRRVKNETRPKLGAKDKPLYTPDDLQRMLAKADLQMRAMILLALNCGFGPKDVRDLTWNHIGGERVTLPRSKRGVCQTYLLWAEIRALLEEIRQERLELEARMAKRKALRCDNGHVFVTRFWKPWSKDAVAEQFRKLCKKAGVPCYGFYRLRHCASTAMSLVATPHVQRKFMRHSQLQQQVTYTHTPDAEVDLAVMMAREKLLGKGSLISSQGKSRDHEEVA
jgi:integrase